MFRNFKISRILLVVLIIYILLSDDDIARRFRQLPELLLNYF